MYVLTVTHGPDQGKRIEVPEGRRCTIGAAPGDTLRLEDPKVLDSHCSVRVVNGDPILENHTASAGTWIGDRKVAKVRLKPGITFRVGDSHIKLTARVKPAAPRPAPPDEGTDDPLLGRIVGGYKVNEVVGRGGMGTVYKATQLSLHRDVALKVLRSKLSKDPAFVDLFVQEAQAAAQLADPNIVQVYDAGTEGDISYFAMEFIGQGSVEELLAQKDRLPWEEAILMVLEAAHGLKYAEGKGIVHRDIKPDNLMINDDGRIKIADLGLAKRGEGKQDQGVIGTPHFIPPEQALGKDVDIRADIYSLGATFFRMITGRTLFSGKTAKEIVLKHIKEPPPAASGIEKSIPDELDVLLARMLAKDPDQRYADTAELIAAIESICAHHGIKGAIIRRGLPKKVLIPVAILVVAAVAVAIHFATQEREVVIDQAAIIRNEELEAQQKKDRKELADRKRTERKLNIDKAWGDLQLREARLTPILETYDDPTKADDREEAWTSMKAAYTRFAGRDDAKEFGKDIDAKTAAGRITKKLAEYKSVQQEKRDWIQAQVKAATTIEEGLRKQLAAFRSERRYGDAINLCVLVGREKPVADDPFRKVEIAVWTNPLDDTDKNPSTKNPKIMAVIKAARENMRKERKVIAGEAASAWETVKQRAEALGEEPKDAETAQVIEDCREIEARFPARTASTPAGIAAIVKQAKRIRIEWENTLARVQAQRVEADRLHVRNTLRQQRSLDPGEIPNFVMECEIGAAIDSWQQRLDRGDLQTRPYQEFARERMRMLRWVDYLFWRFHEDLKATLANKAAGPLATLAVEMPKPGNKTYTDKLTRPPADIFKFAVGKKYKGQKKLGFGQMPMDWVYHAVFFNRGNLRWKERVPVIEFALGIFCMETMQYRLAIPHFEKLVDDPRYGAASKALLARARAEGKALDAYLEIQAVLEKQGATAAEVKDALARLDGFHGLHEGTLFYLNVMRRKDPIRKDVFGLVVPSLPSAPPR